MIFFFRLPFDWKTPSGYLLASIFFAGAIFCLLFGFIPLPCLFVGSCWLFICFATDMKNELKKLNVSAKNKNYRELTQRFSKLIEMHVDVKQLSELFIFKIILLNIANFMYFLEKNSELPMNLTQFLNLFYLPYSCGRYSQFALHCSCYLAN